MAIIKVFDPEGWPGDGSLDGEQMCNFCQMPTGYPFIYWAGGHADTITFHPACARQFAIRLLRDVWQAEHEGLLDRGSPRD